MTLSKIEAMHKRFGKTEGKRCGDCCHLVEREYHNRYFKCEIYGLSCSTATDWAKKWTACGLWNKEYEPNKGRAIYLKEPDNEPMEGQIGIGELAKEREGGMMKENDSWTKGIAEKYLKSEVPPVEIGNKNKTGECGMCGVKVKKLYPHKVGQVDFMICERCKSIMDM